MIGRRRLHEIIFEADTRAGKVYDIALLIVIALSVVVVMLDSVQSLQQRFASLFYGLEWFFTALFTVEYLLRLWCVGKPLKYAFSFFGIIDFLSVVPTYLSLVMHGSRYLVAIRFLRMLRVFRVLKISSYQNEMRIFADAWRAGRRRVAVFLFGVMTVAVVVGTLMYVVENTLESSAGFTSIPRSIYWAIVTVTTVGYGDIAPTTPFGQLLAAVLMILGYSTIVVTTGIVSVEVTRHAGSKRNNTQSCPACSAEGHDDDAVYCKYCGEKL